MRLPNIVYQSKPRQFSQVRFGGIDRQEYHGDGSIYDMMNISTHDFPLLTAIADRYESEKVYENPWYYGKAEKEYVIAGNTINSPDYKLWVSGTIYTVGNQVADVGRIYVCIKDVNKESSTSAPHSAVEYWDIDDSVVFQYDGKWTENTNPKINSVWYYDGLYYRNLTGMNGESNPSEDNKNWIEYSYASFYYDGKEVSGFHLSPGAKECAYLNGYIVILPDNMYYHTDDGAFGYLTGTKSGTFNTADYKGFYYNGKKYSKPLKARLLGSYTSGDTKIPMGAIQMRWDSSLAEGGTTYDYIDVFDLTEIFKEGDAIDINQKFQGKNNSYTTIQNGTYEVTKVTKDTLVFKSNSFAGAYIGDDSVYKDVYYLGDVTFTKGLPEMDYLCVANNRMWGCKEDTVYASELGNVFSWTRYGSEAIDPVYIESGDIGSFTGCCEYGGYPLFFKENEMYRVYGSTALDFSLVKVADYGLRKDSSHSISVVNSILLFLSPQGVCAFTGGIPAVISGVLKKMLSNGVSGTDGKRYYLSVNDGDGRRIYVYDTDNRVWSSEERDAKPLYMVNVGEDLVAMDEQGKTSTVSRPSGNWGNKTEVRHNAYIEFADFYDDYIGKKDVGKVIMRIAVDPTKNPVFVYIQYDSDGKWHRIGKVFSQSDKKKVVEFGFIPRRCDHYRIRLECKGIFTLYSMARQTDLGTV
jgi:hypothetical protein